ncbi:hypothetical protein [[Clostridium] polysaccharolyticum]|uniref:Uncharacterized protein n=1 Tax=[Clostridium] polysaccharolyticum TaxID=29364 RepID=A0A1I0DKL3_9FIRM|nr:hypothetical protein [[Clostridium] polysaccharolyticum]SET32361.1 hypothetical protein SAMN04487772_11513 [[Clostridium] polysaccharolyticum]
MFKRLNEKCDEKIIGTGGNLWCVVCDSTDHDVCSSCDNFVDSRHGCRFHFD